MDKQIVVLHYEELPDYLNIKELQAYLRCGQNKAYALANRPDFPKFCDGSKKIFPKAAVKEWIERNIATQMLPKGIRALQQNRGKFA